MPKQSVTRVIYRFLSGRPLDGQARTDATYLHAGTRALTESGRTTRWAMLPGVKRQAVRLGIPTATYSAFAALSAAPTYTASALSTLAAVGAVSGVRRGRQSWRLRRFNAVYVRPTLAAIAPAVENASVKLFISPELGTLTPRLAKPMSPAEVAVRTWYGEHVEPAVRFLPDRLWRAWVRTKQQAEPVTRRLEVFRRPVDEVERSRIELRVSTPYLSADQRKLISSIISSKIPVSDLIESWDQVGTQVKGVWTVRRQPPSRVGLADIEPHLAELAEDEFILGLTAGNRPWTVSLADDAPHWAVSAGSGAGKSVLAQLVAAQVLRRGGQVIILDIKGSHRWAKGLPGVTYCVTPEQMHHALVKLAQLADKRNQQAFASEEDGWDAGARHLIILEELNATIGMLSDYWAAVRDKGEPKLSPAISAIRFILFTGRSAKVNVLAIAQMLTARAIGGPEARENFAIRALARYSSNAWKMLVPQAAMPRASRVLGRWAVVIGDTVTMVQVAFLTAAQVRALSGVPGSAKTPEARLSSDVRVDVDMTDPLAEPLTLREAIDEGILPWTFEAAQKRLQRSRKAGSSTVPKAVGKQNRADLFRRGDLIIWTESESVK